ncbi:hypothetical protein JHK87_027522 [Glycine soja]|nr:hypothetical protein JHK87_027522 [Glycine soja]
MPPPLEVGAITGVILIACRRQGACHRGNRILRDEAVARLYELGKLGVPNGKCTWSVDGANANAKALLIGSHMDCVFCRIRNILCSVILTLELAKPTLMA